MVARRGTDDAAAAALGTKLRAALATLPKKRRVLVSCEGAFTYLASDYGLDEAYLWPVNAESQVTPKRMARLINTVRDRQIPAIFCESTVSDKNQRQVAAESGARFGGTGEPFDWKIAPETKLPLIVAGGLNPKNVFEAVSLMRPFAVDVSSGVEKASIQKDFQMMREFVEQVRLADEAFNEKV